MCLLSHIMICFVFVISNSVFFFSKGEKKTYSYFWPCLLTPASLYSVKFTHLTFTKWHSYCNFPRLFTVYWKTPWSDYTAILKPHVAGSFPYQAVALWYHICPHYFHKGFSLCLVKRFLCNRSYRRKDPVSFHCFFQWYFPWQWKLPTTTFANWNFRFKNRALHGINDVINKLYKCYSLVLVSPIAGTTTSITGLYCYH